MASSRASADTAEAKHMPKRRTASLCMMKTKSRKVSEGLEIGIEEEQKSWKRRLGRSMCLKQDVQTSVVVVTGCALANEGPVAATVEARKKHV